MRKKIGKRLTAVMIVLTVLLSIMVCQYASAWNEYSGDLPFDATIAEDPYPLSIKDGYYISSTQEYIKYGGKYEIENAIRNIYTFDDNGYLLTKETTVNQIGSEPITYPVVNYSYDKQGRLSSYESNKQKCSFKYNDDGSIVETNDSERDHYTYTPSTFNVLEGEFSFEFDSKGRISKITGVHEPSVGPRFNEIHYTYTEDSSDRVIKRNYEKYFAGKVVQTGVTEFTYSNDGMTEIEKQDNYTKTIVYNKEGQIVSYSLIEKLEDSSNLTYDSVETLYKYTYDDHGNPIVIDIPDTLGGYDHRIKIDYEYHAKKAVPPTPVTPDTPTPDEPTPAPSAKQNGLADSADKDGNWWYYVDGKIDKNHNGVDSNKYGWWRVENGKVNFDAQGIYSNKFGWWKTTNGKVTFKEDGVFNNQFGWWRVEGSKVDFKANGIYSNKFGWWKTTNGKVTFKENGLFSNKFGTWKVENSKVNFNFNGKYQGKTIKNGKVV